jgi:hypothetical protein
MVSSFYILKLENDACQQNFEPTRRNQKKKVWVTCLCEVYFEIFMSCILGWVKGKISLDLSSLRNLAIPFWPEWNATIPFLLEWKPLFQKKWNGHSIPVRMECHF